MLTYMVQYVDGEKLITQRYVRANNNWDALNMFREALKIHTELVICIRSKKRGGSVRYKGYSTEFVIHHMTPTRKELADALYQLTKTYTDGTCYESSNPYSKPHVQEALKVLARYAGTGDYLDALEKMEAIGHVYRYKQP
jgi:hypothetical protein